MGWRAKSTSRYPWPMHISVAWLNHYLDPADLSASDVDAALERAGFPIEDRTDLPTGDVCFDVEITSNRGDCLSHVGLAREAAAATGRRLVLPEIPFDLVAGPGSKTRADAAFDIEIQTPDVCPRFTARLIRGVRVGPSPTWLASALESIGQRPINNIVDASNYVLFELGQPTHTFDLNKLAGDRLVVRWAHDKEKLISLDGRELTLRPDELVVADSEHAVSLAGVIGGEPTSVTEQTTDILLEGATWDPVTVRRAARRTRTTTDAGHRFERIVDPRTIDYAAARCAAIILDVAGGELLQGVIDRGAEPAPTTVISLRPSRCEKILGVALEPGVIVSHLRALDIQTEDADESAESMRFTTPHNRPDLSREIDLIEEVARVQGLDSIPTDKTIAVAVKALAPRQRARRELAGVLTGMGFFETITFSFVSRRDTELFMPKGLSMLAVDEERRAGAPALRPSVIPSLLHCRKVNQDAGVHLEEGVRLFETASVYAETDDGRTVENHNLALMIDAPDRQQAWRQLRGVIEVCARAMAGEAAAVSFEPAPPVFAACDPSAHALVRLGENHLGYASLLTAKALEQYDLKTPVAIAEVNLPALLELYPPKANITALPAFPSIQRDLSVIVDESASWGAIEQTVTNVNPALLDEVHFVGVYRGKQVGAGKKSVTMRLRFGDAARTLRHEEVDPQMQAVVSALQSDLGATLRS